MPVYECPEINALVEKRTKLVKDMHELLTSDEFTSEDKEKFDQMEADERSLKERIDSLARIKDMINAEEASKEASEDAENRAFGDRPLADHRQAGDNGSDEIVDQSRCFRTWALGQHAHPEDIEYARSVNYPLSNHVVMCANRGVDETGQPNGFPKSMEEIRNRRIRPPIKRSQAMKFRNITGAEARSFTGFTVTEQRQQATDPGSAGGFLIPDEMMRPIDVALLAFGGVRSVSTVITTATGADLPIPTVNDTAVLGEIIAENAAANVGDVTFGQVVMKHFKYSSKIVLVSIELMQDSATNLPQLLGRLLGERIGRIHASHMTTGGGTTEPEGVLTGAADSGVTFATAGAMTWEELMDVKHSVDPAYRTMNPSWMMNDASLVIIKKTKDTQDRPLWSPDLRAGEPDRFDGDPIAINQSMPAPTSTLSNILYGAFSKFWIRDILPMTLIRLDELYAASGQVGFLMWSRNDSRVLDAGTGPIKYATMPV